jgi:MoxR-like ATPase
MKAHAPPTRPLQEKFAAARRELSNALIERDQEIDLVLTALLAQEHVPSNCPRKTETS